MNLLLKNLNHDILSFFLKENITLQFIFSNTPKQITHIIKLMNKLINILNFLKK